MLTLVLVPALTVLCVGLFIACFCIRTVQPRQVLLIRERMTGSVRTKVITGPKVAFVLPVIDESITLDLSQRVVSRQFDDVITEDSFLVVAMLDVGFSLDPDLLEKIDLDKFLPYLVGDLNNVVNIWANHILRSVLMGHNSRDLTTRPDLRSRLERQVLKVLQDRLIIFGIRVGVARLLIRPTPAWEYAQVAARQAKLEAEVRAQSWAALAAAMGSSQDLNQLVQLEMLFEGIRSGNAPLHPLIDLPGAGGGNRAGFPAVHWVLDPQQMAN